MKASGKWDVGDAARSKKTLNPAKSRREVGVTDAYCACRLEIPHDSPSRGTDVKAAFSKKWLQSSESSTFNRPP
jgi:hypothetical protein